MSPISVPFLTPIFELKVVQARYQGVIEAARRVHDEHIGDIPDTPLAARSIPSVCRDAWSRQLFEAVQSAGHELADAVSVRRTPLGRRLKRLAQQGSRGEVRPCTLGNRGHARRGGLGGRGRDSVFCGLPRRRPVLPVLSERAMTAPVPKYTTQLQAGLGLVPETLKLLAIWEPGMAGIRPVQGRPRVW